MLKPKANVAVIIVTNNSEKHIAKCMSCVGAQSLPPAQVIIVDSGSKDRRYLKPYSGLKNVKVVFGGYGIGFCRANNLGLSKLRPDIDYLFFLNPDAFITPNYLQEAVSFMSDSANTRCGAITGTTLGYSMECDLPTGLYDTTGIFNKWWGRWYDRSQGQPYNPNAYTQVECIPAICGAVFFCRRKAAEEVMLPGGELFDSRFYMYKEDIDLSLRLKIRGWQLKFVPQLIAYHCRGWNPKRKCMPKKMRLHSARNELTIWRRQRAPLAILYSQFKYWAVKYLDV